MTDFKDMKFKITRDCDRGFCHRGCGRQDKQLNAYDWLADVPGNEESTDLVEVQFKNTRKGYYHNVNNIDLKACEERGIPVRNVAGYSTESVVQETFMHILSLLGNGPYFDNVVKSGAYSASGLFTDVSRPFIEMHGKRIGIIGMGTIGSRVAKVAEAFGMEVVYYSTSGTGHCHEYPSLTLEDLIKTSDVISIHAPYNERTAGLIGLKELEWMKPSAIIVNMGRGGIVDEQALATVIDKDLIGGAALDVFTSEPLPADSPLLHTSHPEKFRFTPHTAWASEEARQRLIEAVAANISKGW